MTNIRLGFIGAGNMAKAIAKGIVSQKVILPESITMYDVNKQAAKSLVDDFGIKTAESPAELAKSSDMLILAVKPNVIAAAIESFGDSLSHKGVISIAAGKNTQTLAQLLPKTCRLLRTMPNTPSMVGEGMTALCANTTLNDDEKAFAQSVFSAIGRFVWVSESLLDAVTAVSGSGPAYAFTVIEAMADGGVREGLPRDLAITLAAQTLLGAAKMVLESGTHPAALRDMVCSPGGTTIDAVYALEQGGLRASLIKAVEVCADKSRKLAK